MFAPARADVAQLVEQRFRKPQVTGSNPVVGSTFGCNNVEANASDVASVEWIVRPR
jgi:hypothetical protein